MKLNIITLAAFSVAALAALSCTETPTFEKADKGPEMKVNSYTESTYMGAQVSVNVNLTDADFALSTVKAYLYYGETEVANTTVRTKEQGDYTVTLQAPLLTDVSDGVAQLKLVSQNVGLGITEQTLDVALQRPNFDEVYLKSEDGTTYTLAKTADYCYALKANFPSYVNGNIVTPAFGSDQQVITLGWDGSALSSEKADLIPFGASIPGTYTVSVNLLTLKASPTDGTTDEAISSCIYLTKGQTMDFGNVVNVESWNFDPDFFTVNTETKKVTFNAVNGLYKMDYDSENQWIKVEPMKDENNTQTLSEDGTGAVWVIGSGFGKPTIGPSWNTTDGAYPMAQVSDKVYQFTLAAPSQLALSGGDIKLFGQKGWGTEFKKANYADIKLEPAFTMTDDGNIKVADVAAGTGYQITLDLTGGINAAKISYKEVEVAESGLDITVNGVKATKMSATVYKVMAAKVEQGSLISCSGIDNPLAWTFDRDNFTLTNEGLKFNSITGYYSFELNIKDQYVVVRHVKEDGKCATYADEGAITFMGWGVGFPMMANQYGFENGMLTTLAQIEKGVYQFTGVAVADEKDTTLVGNCWRTDYLSFKFFGQAGWGVEYNTVTLTDEAAKYLKQDGNMGLADDVTLEAGATYRMTVTNCTALDANSKFDCTIDFRKLD
jgi:hypothetical protein